MQANKEVKKLYYSIGEVSEITELKQYVLKHRRNLLTGGLN